MQQIDRGLRSALAEQEAVIVWGAGQLSMKLLADTVLASKRVAAIVDSSPQRCGMHIGDIEIVPPERLRDLPQLPIVVGSIHSEDSIVRAIKLELALPNEVISLYRGETPVR
jgi:FlaA1/EpsC-like NDP-sugar epimerase